MLMLLIVIPVALLSVVLIAPRVIGYKTMAVLSGSMEPNIPVGSLIYVIPRGFEYLEVGDVVSFKVGGNTIVTHRIVDINPTTREVYTRGDANQVDDPATVREANIVGRQEFMIPYLGYLSVKFQTTLGIKMLGGILIVLIILGFLPGIFESDEKNNKKGVQNEQEEII